MRMLIAYRQLLLDELPRFAKAALCAFIVTYSTEGRDQPSLLIPSGNLLLHCTCRNACASYIHQYDHRARIRLGAISFLPPSLHFLHPFISSIPSFPPSLHFLHPFISSIPSFLPSLHFLISVVPACSSCIDSFLLFPSSCN